MTKFCLEMRSTANWDDVRYRDYTTSASKAAAFKAVPKIRFTDSGHHIIPVVSEKYASRLPPIRHLAEHVRDGMAVAAKAAKPWTARNFIAWLAEDVNTLTAEANTPRDARLKEFCDQGFLKFARTIRDTNEYVFTSKYAAAFR